MTKKCKEAGVLWEGPSLKTRDRNNRELDREIAENRRAVEEFFGAGFNWDDWPTPVSLWPRDRWKQG